MTDQGPGESWEWSDAWVMASVASHGSEGCDLTQLIGAGDACNHAIFLTREIEQGVGRLVASGLLTADYCRFALTADGAALIARKKGGLFGQIDSIAELLARRPVTPGHWPISDAEMTAAATAYHREAARVVRNLFVRKRRPT